MKVLHITPHLGGGVGKAHAALGDALPNTVQRTFVLLEEPRDGRYTNMIEADGVRVVVAPGLDRIAELAAAADIVQFEFWNHPRLYECLAQCDFPTMRNVFWSHISGIAGPVIQPGLIAESDRFVFTSEASRASRSVAMLSPQAHSKIHVINSGFGFGGAQPLTRKPDKVPVIAYLGTVDFIKMHPEFFDAIDGLAGEGIQVAVWGEPSDAVVKRARAMRHSERVRFGGQTKEPATALAQADIFFYPLQRGHYGTAENALVEAMSLGLVPVVLNNPAELAIVRHGETGFVAQSIEECVTLLTKLLSSPELRQRLSRQACRDAAETRTPERSARAFESLWRALLEQPKRPCSFRRVIGDTPAEWFLATQCLPGETWRPAQQSERGAPNKGMLAHFASAFPNDRSLSSLQTQPAPANRR